jgi:hypothetical protein
VTLKKTAARLELLQAVADGAVTHIRSWAGGSDLDRWDRGPAAAITGRRFRVVTGRMHALRTLGLVTYPQTRLGDYSTQVWQLTDAGRDLLVEWGGKP